MLLDSKVSVEFKCIAVVGTKDMGNRIEFIVETVTTKGKATVSRRYSDFKTLWQTLSRVGGLDNLPELPAASILCR